MWDALHQTGDPELSHTRLVRLVVQCCPRADSGRNQFLGCGAAKNLILLENGSVGAQQGLVG